MGVVTLLLLAINLRPAIASVGPVLEQVRAQYGLSYGSVSMLTAIPDLCMGLIALPASRLAARFGRDRTVVASLVLLGVATMLRGWSPNALTLFLATFLSGSAIAISGALISGWVKTHFATRVSLFMGVYATGLSIGATAAAVATQPIATSLGSWHVALSSWGLLAPLGILGWIVASKASRGSGATTAAGEPYPLPWKNATAWSVAGYFASTNLLYYSLLAWTVPYLAESGVPNHTAGFMLGTLIAANMIGNAAAPLLARLPGSRRSWLILCTVCIAAGIVWLAIAPSFFPIGAVLIAGAGNGAAFTFGMTLPLDHSRSPDEAGAWSTFVLLIGYVIAAAGPLLFGVFRDHTGGFTASLVFLLVVALAMLIVAIRMPLPPCGTKRVNPVNIKERV